METNTATTPVIDNGVNVEALMGAREALTQAPEAAQFTWRATSDWVNGTHTRSSVKGFRGLGEDQSHRTEFVFDSDHPEVFAAEDMGATPVEFVLVGLAGCLTAGVASVAQNREIQLLLVGAQSIEEIENLVHYPVRSGAGTINLVDHDNGVQTLLEGLGSHEACLRHGAVNRVDQQQY